MSSNELMINCVKFNVILMSKRELSTVLNEDSVHVKLFIYACMKLETCDLSFDKQDNSIFFLS